MHFDTGYWADDLALRFVVVPDAFGARVWVNHINFGAHRDGIVRALRFAHVAVDALVGNAKRH